jgi:hypothetical protein
MSNQVNHRVPPSDNNQRHVERSKVVSSCSGEGHNGAIGRSDWKTRSRRSERRALNAGTGKVAHTRKLSGRPIVVDKQDEVD